MHVVHFRKEYAEQALDAIWSGQPLPVGPDGWTGHNMLTLAGILYAAVYSHGPHSRQVISALGKRAARLADEHPERREAAEGTLTREVKAAIEFVGRLAFKVMDGAYDADFEPEVTAVIISEDDGGKSFVPVEGFKQL